MAENNAVPDGVWNECQGYYDLRDMARSTLELCANFSSFCITLRPLGHLARNVEAIIAHVLFNHAYS